MLEIFPFKVYEQPRKTKMYIKHVTLVAETLGVAVDSLNDMDALKPILNQLGEKHVDRGVLKEHYPVVMNAIMKTLKDNLGDKWTPSVQKSWQTVLDWVT